MSNKKYEIVVVESNNLPALPSTYKKPMSKKRWKRPNETLWTCVLVVGLFMMSADNFAVLLLALAMMGISIFKLRGIDLDEECNTGIHFNSH